MPVNEESLAQLTSTQVRNASGGSEVVRYLALPGGAADWGGSGRGRLKYREGAGAEQGTGHTINNTDNTAGGAVTLIIVRYELRWYSTQVNELPQPS